MLVNTNKQQSICFFVMKGIVRIEFILTEGPIVSYFTLGEQ